MATPKSFQFDTLSLHAGQRPDPEHGVIELAGPGSLTLGQKIRLIPGHCDPTVNLYDWLVCYRGERVEEFWPIAARGAFY